MLAGAYCCLPSLVWAVQAVNQHSGDDQTKYDRERWLMTFKHCIELIGHTCLVIDDWRAPAPLQRVRCMWECYATFETQA